MRRLALLLPLVLLTPVTAVTHAAVFEARVASVEAGDRIVIETQDGRRELRIAGIDAPDEGQEYADRYRRELGRIVRNAHVLVQTPGDEYDAVGQVAVKRTDAGLHQLEKGCAWVLKDDLTRLPDGWVAAYLEAERKAFSAPLGLWKSERPVPPWTWRKMKRDEANKAAFEEAQDQEESLSSATHKVMDGFDSLKTAVLSGKPAQDKGDIPEGTADKKKTWWEMFSDFSQDVSRWMMALWYSLF